MRKLDLLEIFTKHKHPAMKIVRHEKRVELCAAGVFSVQISKHNTLTKATEVAEQYRKWLEDFLTEDFLVKDFGALDVDDISTVKGSELFVDGAKVDLETSERIGQVVEKSPWESLIGKQVKINLNGTGCKGINEAFRCAIKEPLYIPSPAYTFSNSKLIPIKMDGMELTGMVMFADEIVQTFGGAVRHTIKLPKLRKGKSLEKRLLHEIKKQLKYHGCFDSKLNAYWGDTNKKRWARDLMLVLAEAYTQQEAIDFIKYEIFHASQGWDYDISSACTDFYLKFKETFDRIGYAIASNKAAKHVDDWVEGEFDALFQM